MSLNSFIKLLILTSFVFFVCSDIVVAKANIPEMSQYNKLSKDSLLLLVNDVEGEELAYINFAIGNHYDYDMFDSAAYYFEQAFLFAEKYSLDDFSPAVLQHLARAVFRLGDITKALQTYMLALEKALGNGDNDIVSSIYNDLYLLYNHLGNREVALNVLLKSLSYKDQEEVSLERISNYISIAAVFYRDQQYQPSIEYLKNAEEMILCYEDNCDSVTLFKSVWSKLLALNYHALEEYELESYYNLYGENLFLNTKLLEHRAGIARHRGDYFLKIGKNSQALPYYIFAFNNYSKLSDFLRAANIASRIAHVEEISGRYHKQLYYNKIAFDFRSSVADSNATYNSLANIGNAYINIGKLDSAIYFLNIADKYFFERENLVSLSRIAHLTYKLYVKKGDYEKALFYFQKYSELQKKMSNENISHNVTAMRFEYEYDLQEQREKNAAIKNQRRQIYIYTMISFVVLFIVIFLLITLYNRNRISEDNIRLQQKLLRSQMNPHFIFNSLVAIQNYIYRKDTLEAVKYLSSFAKLIRLFLNNSREDLISLKQELETINYYFELQLLRFSDKFDFVVSVDENFDQDSVFLPPGLIQPFVENAIEHGVINKEKGRITVNFTKLGNNLRIEIMDNGDGIRKSIENKQDLKKYHKSLATTITKERFYYLNRNLIGRKSCFLKTEDVCDKAGVIIGTKVLITLPINTESTKN